MIKNFIRITFLTIIVGCFASEPMQLDHLRAGHKRTYEDDHEQREAPQDRIVVSLGERFIRLLENNNNQDRDRFMVDCTLALSYYEQFTGNNCAGALTCARLRLMQHIANKKLPIQTPTIYSRESPMIE